MVVEEVEEEEEEEEETSNELGKVEMRLSRKLLSESGNAKLPVIPEVTSNRQE